MSQSYFTDGYIRTAVWADGPEGWGVDDLSPAEIASLVADAELFYAANMTDIHVEGAPEADLPTATAKERVAAKAGHDFWQQRHGRPVGLWDGDWPEPQRQRLCEAAIAAAPRELLGHA